MDEKTTNENLFEEAIKKKFEELERLEAGTEEHSRLIDDICKLQRTESDRYKIEADVYNQSVKIENDKLKDEHEIEVKRLQADNEAKKYKRVKPDTIVMIGGYLAITAGAFYYQAMGHILPSNVLKLGDKLMKFPTV